MNQPKSPPANVPDNRASYVFALTDAGEAKLYKIHSDLSSLDQELLLRIDGRKTRNDLAVEMKHVSWLNVNERLNQLQKGGLIVLTPFRAPKDTSLDFTTHFKAKVTAPALSSLQRERLHKESHDGANLLQRHGYYVSIAKRASGKIKPRSGEKYLVLLVEDDVDIAKVVKLLLESEGFQVSVAVNRAEIVRAMAQVPLPDLVLLDVMLPDADGFDVLRKIRAHPALKSLRVIMLTAKATRDDVMQGLENGADGYITKPFDLDRLVEGVNAVLGN